MSELKKGTFQFKVRMTSGMDDLPILFTSSSVLTGIKYIQSVIESADVPDIVCGILEVYRIGSTRHLKGIIDYGDISLKSGKWAIDEGLREIESLQKTKPF